MTTQDVRQIKIGKHMIGIVGLKGAFESLARDGVDHTDAALSHILLERLTKKNYIPEKVREKYGLAFVREFRRFLGHAFEDEGSEGLVIKVLGAGCAICDGLENTVMETLATMGLAADLEHVRDAEQISAYKVQGTPALVIDGKVVSTGRNPPNHEIRKFLEAAGYNNPSGGKMDKQVFINSFAVSRRRPATE